MRFAGVHALLVVAACGGRDPARTDVVPPQQPVPATSSRERLVVFAGAPISISLGALAEPVEVTPPLPATLKFDPKTGTLSGKLDAIGTTIYRVHDAKGVEHPVSLSVIEAGKATDRYVAGSGNDDSAGTVDHPFKSIKRALQAVTPGTTIFLRSGTYLEDVSIRGIHGDAQHPIVIRAYPGENVMLAGEPATITWSKATEDAAPDEWISNETFKNTGSESTSRGAFTDRKPFTRLLTYSRGEDFHSTNQRWLRDDPDLPGAKSKKGVKVPWTYFGPGIWHDPATGKVHVRLSPTTINTPGIVDYTGPSDPSKVPLMIWARSSTPLTVADSSDLEIHDILVRGGGDDTVEINQAQQILLDHVDIDASSVGLVIKKATGIRFLHGKIDGGIPSWSFRSDFKDAYKTVLPDGTQIENNLVRKTSRGLMYVGNESKNLEVGYCELENGHDIYFAGIDSEIHHCRIRNIHDEALFISHTEDISNLRVHDNVFEKVLSAISGIGNKVSGARYLYRNIFDLREPTQSYRPGVVASVWRRGGVFKGRVSSAPFFFYQNTILIHPEKAGQPALLHYRNLTGDSYATWFLNNVVVLGGDEPVPFAFEPDPAKDDRVDPDGRRLVRSEGNAWVRIGQGKQPLFTCVAEKGQRCTARNWSSLDGLRVKGGRETGSRIAQAPGFRRFQRSDAALPGDNLRPGPDSPARNTAVPLPPELPDDVDAANRKDAGALESNAPPLYIGVDGRYSY